MAARSSRKRSRRNPLPAGSLHSNRIPRRRLSFESLEQRFLLDGSGLRLQLGQASVTEGETLQATVTIDQPAPAAVTVALAQSQDNQFGLPAVVIPAGETSVTFAIPTINDTLIEKNKHMTLTASSPGFADAAANVDLYDDDVPAISLSLDHDAASESVGANAAIGTVTRDKVSDRALTVYLAASHPTRMSVPDQVIIPAGEASVSFAVATINDQIINPPVLATIYAHGAYPECGCPIEPGATASFEVTDAVGPTLTVSLAKTFIPEGTSTVGTLSRNTDLSLPLVVQLSIADTAQAMLPATVTIPAGARSVDFTVTTIDDGVLQSRPETTITVAAAGYISGSASLDVQNVDPPPLAVATIPAAHSGGSGVAQNFLLPDGSAGGIDFYATSSGLFRLTAAGSAIQLTTAAGIDNLTPLGNVLYFAAADAAHGRELWRSDGTVVGTYLVKDVQPGASGSSIDHLTVAGSTLFFSADDGSHGNELWKSDGTAAGTTMLTDAVTPGHHLIFATSFVTAIDTDTTVPPSTPYFGGLDAADYTVTFAAAQAGLIPNWNNIDIIYHVILSTNGHNAKDRINVQGPVYNRLGDLIAVDAADFWDGSHANPVRYDETGSVITGEERAWSGTKGDGTWAGINASCTSWNSLGTTASCGDVTGSNPIWISGCSANCSADALRLYGVSPLIAGGDISSDPADFVALGNTLYFTAFSPLSGRELWKSDGTPGGTVLVADIAPSSGSSGVANLTVARGKLWFTAVDGVHGRELWVTDNTSAGAHLVDDIKPGSGGSTPFQLTALGDRLLLLDDSDANPATEIWSVNMTAEAATLLTSGNGVPNNTQYSNLAVLGSRAYFTINDQALYATDGTPSGTTLVKQIRGIVMGQTSNSPPSPIVVNGSRLYFTADDGVTGRELWTSDGTPTGTTLVKDVNAQLGQQHHLIFATSFVTSIDTDTSVPPAIPAFGGLDAADYTVTFAAAQAGLIPNWNNVDIIYHAILSTDGHEAKDRINVQGPVYNRLNQLIANDATDLWDGSIVNPVRYDETGSVVSGEMRVWSGTDVDGTWAGINASCNSWSSQGENASAGLVSVSNSIWIDGGLVNCSADALRLYGVSPLFAFDGAAAEPTNAVNVGNPTYFLADDGVHGRELWRTDGTALGTSLVKDIAAGAASATITSQTALGGRLLFLVGSGASAVLWESDGTDAGTHAVVVSPLLSVTNTMDDGSGSLRSALADANATPGVEASIQFTIPGAGSQTIAPLSALPVVSNPLTVALDPTQNVTVALSSGAAWHNNSSLTVSGRGRLNLRGGVEGTGTLTINAGGNLTVGHIIQGSLVIGGDANSFATLTLAASDADGNPLADFVEIEAKDSLVFAGDVSASSNAPPTPVVSNPPQSTATSSLTPLSAVTINEPALAPSSIAPVATEQTPIQGHDRVSAILAAFISPLFVERSPVPFSKALSSSVESVAAASSRVADSDHSTRGFPLTPPMTTDALPYPEVRRYVSHAATDAVLEELDRIDDGCGDSPLDQLMFASNLVEDSPLTPSF